MLPLRTNTKCENKILQVFKVIRSKYTFVKNKAMTLMKIILWLGWTTLNATQWKNNKECNHTKANLCGVPASVYSL